MRPLRLIFSRTSMFLIASPVTLPRLQSRRSSAGRKPPWLRREPPPALLAAIFCFYTLTHSHGELSSELQGIYL